MSETVDSLKQRLVGAFVILSLAIIFLPMIFDKPHNESDTLVVSVPPKPEFKTFEIAKPSKPDYKVLELDKRSGKIVEAHGETQGSNTIATSGLTKGSGNTSSSIVAAQTPISAEKAIQAKKQKAIVAQKAVKKQASPKTTVAKKVSKPTVSHLPIFKNVWMVQLGTFGSTKNAYRLRDRLRKDGFDGHTKIVTLSGKKAIKVFTGPFVKKRDAAKTKKRVDQKYKVDSRIIFFDA